MVKYLDIETGDASWEP